MPANQIGLTDRAVWGYNLILAAVWLAVLPRAVYAPWILSAHLATLALPTLIGRLPGGAGGFTRALRELYPIVWVAGFWGELDLLRDVLGFETGDAPIARLDLWVFGMHVHEIWLPRMSQLWFSEPMFFSYFAYFLAVFVPPLVAALRARWDVVRGMALAITATYLTCYLVYIAFPVDGPAYLLEAHAGPHQEGLIYRVTEAVTGAGSSRGCSFPSSHVAGAVTAAVIGWRWLPRWAAWLLTVEAFGVFLSTTYVQNHYAVDSIAGVVWALAIQLVLLPAVLRREESRAWREIAPVLPGAVLAPEFGD